MSFIQYNMLLILFKRLERPENVSVIVLQAQLCYACGKVEKKARRKMAVVLRDLYAEIGKRYKLQLQTEDCFMKVIEWIHMIEDKQFIKLLHGDELILNTGISYTSTEWLLDYVKQLYDANAGGLVICVRDGQDLPEEVLAYANKIRFPIFTAGWDCPFVELTREFAEALLKREQKESKMIAALKNAIYYPKNEESYLNHFERNGFHREQRYTVAIISCHSYRTPEGNPKLKEIEKWIQYSAYQSVVYEEQEQLVVLAGGSSMELIVEDFKVICEQDSKIYIGIGTVVEGLQKIHESFEHAVTAYQLTKTAIDTNMLMYDKLGVYKLLSNLKEDVLREAYVEEVLGALIHYDEENGSEYMYILEKFFENECSILYASKELYCHKNTLTYKLNKIKEILGYDIMTNENRMRILLSFCIIKMRL